MHSIDRELSGRALPLFREAIAQPPSHNRNPLPRESKFVFAAQPSKLKLLILPIISEAAKQPTKLYPFISLLLPPIASPLAAIAQKSTGV
jgi:hypothetical protein